LTLIFCIWRAPAEIYNTSSSSALGACSIILYVITERWSHAKKYRDTFEDIKEKVTSSILNDKATDISTTANAIHCPRNELPQSNLILSDPTVRDDSIVQQIIHGISTGQPVAMQNESHDFSIGQGDVLMHGLQEDAPDIGVDDFWEPGYHVYTEREFMVDPNVEYLERVDENGMPS
jgi:hypothetical protein